jgi:hypothetical protein
VEPFPLSGEGCRVGDNFLYHLFRGRRSSLRCGRSTLTLIFPGKTSAPIGRTGAERCRALLE